MLITKSTQNMENVVTKVTRTRSKNHFYMNFVKRLRVHALVEGVQEFVFPKLPYCVQQLVIIIKAS